MVRKPTQIVISRDGDIDVLGAARIDDDITWWENTDSNGTAWTRRDVNDNFNGASSVYAADVDGEPHPQPSFAEAIRQLIG